jgi:antitoxin HicB
MPRPTTSAPTLPLIDAIGLRYNLHNTIHAVAYKSPRGESPMPRKKRTAIKQETLYKLPLVLEPQPEGGYTLTCPLLPELITEGDTAQEALSNVPDALAALLAAYQHLQRPIPAVLRQDNPGSPLWLESLVALR